AVFGAHPQLQSRDGGVGVVAFRQCGHSGGHPPQAASPHGQVRSFEICGHLVATLPEMTRTALETPECAITYKYRHSMHHWRSLDFMKFHSILHGVQGVPSSNLGAPTNLNKHFRDPIQRPKLTGYTLGYTCADECRLICHPRLAGSQR